MDASNPSSKANLLQEDRLSLLRRRNRTLILAFFSLIILLALIIGGIIISLVRKHCYNPPSPRRNPALQEFCAPSGYEITCIIAFSGIRVPPNADPNEIFILCLQISVGDLSTIISAAFNETRPGPASGNCSRSLGHAVGQLHNILRIMWVNPDVERQSNEERSEMTASITEAIEDLTSCRSDLGKVGSTAAGEVSAQIYEVAAMVGYGKDFLHNCDAVNENFRFGLAIDEDQSSRNQIVQNLIDVSLFGSQYFVLVLLFCLFLRIY